MADDAVDDASAPAPVSSARAANQQLLQALVAGLVQDPEADLRSLVPPEYENQLCSSQGQAGAGERKLSKAAGLNRKLLERMLSKFDKHSEDNLLNAIPESYESDRERWLRKNQVAERDTSRSSEESGDNCSAYKSDHPFFASGEHIEPDSLEIAATLSPLVESLLQGVRGSTHSQTTAEALCHLIWSSKCIWLEPMGGRYVLQLNDDVAIKVTDDDQGNHHAALDFLAAHAPELSIPRSHGMVWFGGRCLLFTSFIPGSTLEDVWPTLTHTEKSSITQKLNNILTTIRAIDRSARPLGLINGQGVLDERGFQDEFRSANEINTVAEFEDFVFSYKPWISNTFVSFLQSLLPASRLNETCVFTHCDFRPANIMVKEDESGWTVTGILDWEGSGFYPAYWEAVKSTKTFVPNHASDWWLMQPRCIAPSTYATYWLVDRLWDDMTERLKRFDQDPRVANGAAARDKQAQQLWDENEQTRANQQQGH